MVGPEPQPQDRSAILCRKEGRNNTDPFSKEGKRVMRNKDKIPLTLIPVGQDWPAGIFLLFLVRQKKSYHLIGL